MVDIISNFFAIRHCTKQRVTLWLLVVWRCHIWDVWCSSFKKKRQTGVKISGLGWHTTHVFSAEGNVACSWCGHAASQHWRRLSALGRGWEQDGVTQSLCQQAAELGSHTDLIYCMEEGLESGKLPKTEQRGSSVTTGTHRRAEHHPGGLREEEPL